MTTNKNAFCTIISADYLHYACALRDSLKEFDSGITLFVFVSCKKEMFRNPDLYNLENIVLLFIDQLCEESYGQGIYKKYFISNLNFFRWCMKPVVMKYIIENMSFRKVLYVDGDMFFFNDSTFLFELLDEHSIILSPHNRSLNFESDEQNFRKNFSEGIYNGGFIGVREDAEKALTWWASACLYMCSKEIKHGFYGDQKYLDIFPARFEKVMSLQHLGCNVAEWNKTDCRRVAADTEVTINGIFKIIFIHFTGYTILDILNGKDILLRPYLEAYNTAIKQYKPEFDIIEQYQLKIEKAIASAVPAKSQALKQGLKRKAKKLFNKFSLF